MEPFKDDRDLAAALSALRPTPRPAFAAELDERAAAGFPRRFAAASPLAGLGARLRSLRPRQVLIPAGATALAAVAAVTVVVAVSEPGSSQNDGATGRYLAPLNPQPQAATGARAGVATSESSGSGSGAADVSGGSGASGGSAVTRGENELQYTQRPRSQGRLRPLRRPGRPPRGRAGGGDDPRHRA